MAQIITVSLDLTKIDKSRINNHSNGSKYYSIDIVVNDKKDNYGNDVSVSTSQSKEQRDAKEKKTYIGNGRVVWQKNAEPTYEAPQQTTLMPEQPAHAPAIDNLPF